MSKTQHCTECGTTHPFPEPNFAPGDRVEVVETGDGYWHRDKVGRVVTVAHVHRPMSMPCDEPEYLIREFPEGAIRESRLRKAN